MSKLLLGNQDRLEVGEAIARSEDGLVNATDLGLELGIAQPRVRNQQWFQRRDGSSHFDEVIAIWITRLRKKARNETWGETGSLAKLERRC